MRGTRVLHITMTIVLGIMLGSVVDGSSDHLAHAQTTCPSPTNFRSTGGTSSTLDVAWGGVPAATSYDVWYAPYPDSPSALYAGGFTGTTATLYSLVTGTTYNFAVKAYCPGTASALSNTITATPGGSTVTTCQPPRNLRVTKNDTSAQTVDLAWDLPDGPTPSSYTAYVSQVPGGPYTLWASGLPASPARLFSLGSTDWYIVVRSVCAGVESANSNEVRRSGAITTPTTTPPAANVCPIDPADGEVAINAAIAGCPNGTVSAPTEVRFPPNRHYRQAHRILVADRHNLVINGNGSTFTTTSNGTVTKSIDGNFVVLRGSNVSIKNMTVRGDFTAYEGQPRSLATIGTGDPEFTEAQMGIGYYGVDGGRVEDVKAFNHWGDGLTTGSSEYVDGSVSTYTRNLFIKRMEVETVGRMCWGPTSGNNIWIEDSICRDAWYGGLDAEADNEDQPLSDHHYLRNTFDGYNHFGILIPVLTKNAANYEFRDNTFLTPNDNPTFTVVQVHIYQAATRTRNVVIEGNKIPFYCQAIAVDNVDGGSIRNNTLTRVYKPLPDGSGNYTPVGICGQGNTDPIEVTDSTNITLGPNTVVE